LNKDEYAPDGRTHVDRNVITGDSPDAANALGKLAVAELLKVYK
jgi:molecular chaperone Hsp31 and glyoxalase 3